MNEERDADLADLESDVFDDELGALDAPRRRSTGVRVFDLSRSSRR